MTRALRWGLIGCGRVSERIHVPALRAFGGVTVVAVHDRDRGRAEAAAGEWPDARHYGKIEALLDAVDGVSICTPNDAHAEAALAASAAGIPTLCEKPLAATVDAAAQIAAAAAVAPAPFGVNLCYRFHELLGRLDAEIAGSTLAAVELDFRTPGKRAWRPVTGWYDDPARAGGGALLDIGIHGLDVLTRLLGRPEVTAAQVDDRVLEQAAVLELAFPATRGVLRVDRASRGFALALRCDADDGRTIVLDFRRGTLGVDGVVVASTAQPVELEGVLRFLAHVRTGAGDHVLAGDALVLQQLVEAARGVAVVAGAYDTSSTPTNR